MYATIRNIRSLHPPIDSQLSIFDTIVRPIMLYGSEVWGLIFELVTQDTAGLTDISPCR